MAAKKATGKTAATLPHIRLITHTARMQSMLEARPDHPRKKEYADVIKQYRGTWAGISPDQRKAAVAAAEEADPSMTSKTIKAAVAALEG